MQRFEIYLIGVGGQGIGLLSEVLLRAIDHAGFPVKGVDTHGLAQRGGTVISHIRIGSHSYNPIVSEHSADLVIALERHEAFRALNSHLKDGGTLAYYNAVWQPLGVRLQKQRLTTEGDIEALCKERNIREVKVFKKDLKDTRMQNMEVLAEVVKQKCIPGLTLAHVEEALRDLADGPRLESNLGLLRSTT